MKISEFLFAILLGYLVSSMFVIFFGKHGMEAYDKLKEQKEILVNNIAELKETRLSLEDKLQRLKEGTELLKLMSRELGYVEHERDQAFYTLEGYKAAYIQYNPGKMIYLKHDDSNPNLFFRILGFLIGFMVYTIILVCIRIADNGTKDKKPPVISRNNQIIKQE